MNAYITIRGITKEHAATVDALKKRFSVGSASGAVSELLSAYPKERARLELLERQLAQVVRLIQDRSVCAGIAESEAKKARDIEADLFALVKQIAKAPRQSRLDL